MFDSAGLYGSTGIVVAILIVVAVFPVMIVQWKGYKWREGTSRDLGDGNREKV